MSDFDQLASSYERHIKAQAQANEQNKAAVFDALAAAGVTTVTVEFDGECDSGQIEAVTACAGETHVTLPATPVTLRHVSWRNDVFTSAAAPLSEAIENLCFDYLSQKHGGWEDNDGGFGQFTLYVAEAKIELEFNGRYTDVHTSNYTF